MSDYEKTIQEWFKDHVAERQLLTNSSNGEVNEMDVLAWKKPDTNICRVDYMFHKVRRVLFVTGDLGHAVYRFGTLDLEQIAACDLHYFTGKCEASEVGRDFDGWSEELAKATVRPYWQRLAPDKKREYKELEGDDSIYDKHEWLMWLHFSGSKVFGDDELIALADAGKTPHIRCQAHLMGLKMAFEQLNNL